MIHLPRILDVFTLVGMLVCLGTGLAATLLLGLWFFDKVVSAILRTLGWLGPVNRFMRLDYQEKLRVKAAFEREQRERDRRAAGEWDGP